MPCDVLEGSAMTTQYIAVGIQAYGLSPGDEGDDRFEALLDGLVDELGKIGYPDADYVASLAKREAEIFLAVGELKFPEAIQRVTIDLRTALHAADCEPAEWPDPDELLQSFRRVTPERDGDGDVSDQRDLIEV
jgi:hypothetical protein